MQLQLAAAHMHSLTHSHPLPSRSQRALPRTCTLGLQRSPFQCRRSASAQTWRWKGYKRHCFSDLPGFSLQPGKPAILSRWQTRALGPVP